MGLSFLSTCFSTTVIAACAHRSTAAFYPGQTHRCATTTVRNMSTGRASAGVDEGAHLEPLRVLALHGSGSSGEDFASRLVSYKDLLEEDYKTRLEVTAFDAPVPKEDGFAWWSLPPYVRSFNATKYEGFDKSSEIVLKSLENAEKPFDIIYGHSQGAILTTALLALNCISNHPTRGYILNGVAWPNPYSNELESLEFDKEPRPRILLLTGMNDQINPPETQGKVMAALEKAGAQVSQIQHPGGHNIPMQRGHTLHQIFEWILK